MKLTCKTSLYTLLKQTSHIKARIRFSEHFEDTKGGNPKPQNEEQRRQYPKGKYANNGSHTLYRTFKIHQEHNPLLENNSFCSEQ